MPVARQFGFDLSEGRLQTHRFQQVRATVVASVETVGQELRPSEAKCEHCHATHVDTLVPKDHVALKVGTHALDDVDQRPQDVDSHDILCGAKL